MRSSLNRCKAVTHFADGYSSPCAQEATYDDGYCYKCHKVSLGLMAPSEDYVNNSSNMPVAVSREHSMTNLLWKLELPTIGKPTKAPEVEYDMFSLANDV